MFCPQNKEHKNVWIARYKLNMGGNRVIVYKQLHMIL